MINWAIKKEIELFFKDIKNKQILDFGCGDARYKKYIDNSNNYKGLDVAESGHSPLDKNYDVLWDKKKLPFENDVFDIVLMTEVLEHVENVDITLREINRVLKIGGSILVTVPFIWPEHQKPYDFQRYTSFGIKKVFDYYGFETIYYKKLVQKKYALLEIIISDIETQFKDYNKKNMNHFFLRLYFKILKLFIKIIFKFFIHKNMFKDIYICNCLIVKKKLTL